MKRHLFAITAILFASACEDPGETCQDDAAAEAPREASLPIAGPRDGPDDIRFREQGIPEAWYITTWKGSPIKTAQFAAAVMSCIDVADPQWTCTLSWYAPDVSKTDLFVGGLGCSAYFSAAFKKCLFSKWTENGAIKLP